MHLKLYNDFANWWPLISAPADYAEEAKFFSDTLIEMSKIRLNEVLELGSGGGNNALHMKVHFALTLVDVSNGMLEVSRKLNPDCEHVEGDMRTVRLEKQYDAVFLHDAIDYMTSKEDLSRAMETAFVHCKPGGVALFVPDHICENFEPGTSQGGHDGKDRSMRYLEWQWDPDPTDVTHLVDYVFAFRDAEGNVTIAQDRHRFGLFAREEWLSLMRAAGFVAHTRPFNHTDFEKPREVFIGIKPNDAKG